MSGGRGGVGAEIMALAIFAWVAFIAIVLGLIGSIVYFMGE